MNSSLGLLAKDAMTTNYSEVLAEQRPPRNGINADHQFAVFDNVSGTFLGLVGIEQVSRHPERIFADLVQTKQQRIIAHDTPLKELRKKIKEQGTVFAVCTDTDKIIGAVTRSSLLERLFDWHQSSCTHIRADRNRLISEQQKLKISEMAAQRLATENRLLNQELITRNEAFRKKLARELHDETAQKSTAITHYAQLIIEKCTDQHHHEIAGHARTILNIGMTLHKDIRAIIQQLRPELLDSIGFAAAIEDLTNKWQQRNPAIQLVLDVQGLGQPLPESVNIGLYRIIQEALNNISQHSQANRARIEAHGHCSNNGQANAVHLKIQDNGQGFDQSMTTRGFGLIGITERTTLLQGQIQLHTRRGAGVRIEIQTPILDNRHYVEHGTD